MPKHQFYEPLIQEEQPKMVEIRGFGVAIGGTYVLMDDVVSALRDYAQSLEEANDALAIHDAVTWLVGGERTLAQVTPEPQPVSTEIHGAETDDVTLDVDRVELFPIDAGQGRRKWHARSIDTAGNVMKVTGGSFDKEWVEKNARDRWPGIPMYEVQDESERSMTKERQKRGYAHELWSGHHA